MCKVFSTIRNSRKLVGIIGASNSGILAAKELMEVGCDVVLFEYHDNVGGIIANSYNALQCTGSSTLFSFGCLSTGTEEKPVYWKLDRYIQYLNDLCDEFKIRQFIRFGREVTLVKPYTDENGRKRFSLSHRKRDGDSSTEEIMYFDHIVIATGTSSGKPIDIAKNLQGRSKFQGEVMHSSEFRGGKSCEGKNVVLVGLGESGSDIIHQAAATAKSSCMVARSGPGFVVPRYLYGRAADLDTSRSHHGIPVAIWNIPGIREIKLWLESFYLEPGHDDLKVLKKISEFNKDLGVKAVFTRYGTKNEGLAKAMLEYGTKYKRTTIAGFKEDSVIFSDGSSLACDVLIMATGFQYSPTFVKRENFKDYNIDPEHWFDSSRQLYKRIIHPEIGIGIGVIGIFRPAFGSFSPLIELQARYYAGLVSGHLQLPSTTRMKQVAKADEQRELEFFPMDKTKPLLHFAGYSRELAEMIGCNPPKTLIFTDPILWWRLFSGQISAQNFRLFGPGKIEGTREKVLSIPMMPLPLLLFNAALYFFCWLLYNITRLDCFKPLA